MLSCWARQGNKSIVNIIETRDSNDANLLVKKVLAWQIGGYIVPAPASEYLDLLKTPPCDIIVRESVTRVPGG
jgi:hypothetical protein